MKKLVPQPTTINIFCVLAKTGAGKSTYINEIINDEKFMKNNNLSLLVYGTTRKKQENEKEGVDYHYNTAEQFKKITDDELIEARSYYTMNDGEIYYFTKCDYFKDNSNYICISSPYQLESFLDYFGRENIKNHDKYRIFIINIETSLTKRIERLIKRSKCDNDIYEMCRRVIQEKNEFSTVEDHFPTIIDKMNPNALFINNDCNSIGIKKNLKIIKRFIQKNCK